MYTCHHLSPTSYGVDVEDCWERSPTSTNLGNDHGFISKEYISIGTRHFGKVQSKAMRAYAQNGQYRTIVEVRDS